MICVLDDMCTFVKVQHNNNNNNNNNGVFSAQGGVEKHRFQQSTSTQTGAGEKETLNINVVGKSFKNMFSFIFGV